MPTAFQVFIVALLGLVLIVRVIVNVYDRPTSSGRSLDDHRSRVRHD